MAVYPNFSQIFVAGGQTNDGVATRHCERYILKDEKWKRLPELKEAKAKPGLCFFNNGSTIYCFGGDNSQNIERLSKGQNSWAILGLKMPAPGGSCNAACISLNQKQIMILGGSAKLSLVYTNTDAQSEGHFNNLPDSF